MKEHKKQILAALALAFALGAVAPTAVFASEGTGAGANAGEVISQSYAENIANLYNKIQKDGSFANYRAAVPLVQAVAGMEEYTKSAESVLSNLKGLGTLTVWGSLSDETKAALNGKDATEAVDIIKKTDDYAALSTQIDALGTSIATAKSNLVTQVKTYYAADPGVDNMSVAELIAAARSISGFSNYVALYNAMNFTNGWVTGSAAMTAAIVEAKLPDTAMQAAGYTNMATAAKKISPNALDGLLALPDTSAPGEDDKKPSDNKPTDNKPNTPNTGIVGLFESGALDLGMLTLIVSVGLASVAGLALIAKLYLKHKF